MISTTLPIFNSSNGTNGINLTQTIADSRYLKITAPLDSLKGSLNISGDDTVMGSIFVGNSLNVTGQTTFSNNLPIVTSNPTPTLNNQLVCKQYVDNQVSSGSSSLLLSSNNTFTGTSNTFNGNITILGAGNNIGKSDGSGTNNLLGTTNANILNATTITATNFNGKLANLIAYLNNSSTFTGNNIFSGTLTLNNSFTCTGAGNNIGKSDGTGVTNILGTCNTGTFTATTVSATSATFTNINSKLSSLIAYLDNSSTYTGNNIYSGTSTLNNNLTCTGATNNIGKSDGTGTTNILGTCNAATFTATTINGLSSTLINYMSGLTGNIQNQINSLPTSVIGNDNNWTGSNWFLTPPFVSSRLSTGNRVCSDMPTRIQYSVNSLTDTSSGNILLPDMSLTSKTNSNFNICIPSFLQSEVTDATHMPLIYRQTLIFDFTYYYTVGDQNNTQTNSNLTAFGTSATSSFQLYAKILVSIKKTSTNDWTGKCTYYYDKSIITSTLDPFATRTHSVFNANNSTMQAAASFVPLAIGPSQGFSNTNVSYTNSGVNGIQLSTQVSFPNYPNNVAARNASITSYGYTLELLNAQSNNMTPTATLSPSNLSPAGGAYITFN